MNTQLSTCSEQRDSCDAASKALKTELQSCKSSGSSGSGAASACQAQLIQLQKQCAGGNSSQVQSLRVKLQVVFNLAGVCRKNFFSLVSDKNQVTAAFAELRQFINKMPDINSVKGDIKAKYQVLLTERSNFKRRFELVSKAADLFFN